MRGKKTWMALLTVAVVLMALSLTFAVPSGAILNEAKQRYQDEAPMDWGDDGDIVENEAAGVASVPYRIVATAGESDVNFDFGSDETGAPVPAADALELAMDTVGRKLVEANFTDAGYSDDTITVSIQEVKQDDSSYHVAYVKIASPTQLRTCVVGGINGTGTLPTTTVAESVNAVVAVNGDFFEKYSGGYIVRQGETLRKRVSDNYDLLLIDENADFHLLLAGKDRQKDGIGALLKEHDIVNAFFFGPALVMDGATCEVSEHYGWNPYGQEPRAAIGQLGPLSYAVVTVDGRIDESAGVTLPTLAAFMAQIGCTQAYNLDGGNSSALVFHNELLSIKGVEERSVNDIVYFASATEQGD